MPYIRYTVFETPTFITAAEKLWSDDERLAFISWISANPDAGDVIPESGGCRKVRWTRRGMGKRGGSRIIYFSRTSAGEVWLLFVYAKSADDSIPASILRQLRQVFDHE